MAFQLSPGVAVVEKDFSSIVPAVSSSTGAFAGAFQWGPVMDPITISSENELVRQFGRPSDANYEAFFTAANFLSYSNNLLTVRADAGHLNAVATVTGGISAVSLVSGGTGYSVLDDAPVVTVGAPEDTATQSFVITVVNDGVANVFVVDGVNKPELNLVRGGVYTFIQSDASNAGHPLAFKNSADEAFIDGVVTTGTPGQAGAQTVFTVPEYAPADLRYYCTVHGDYMGNTISVTGAAGTVGGIQAVVTAVLAPTGVAAVAITSGGTGYTTASITISAPTTVGGTQATATAVIDDGVITGVTITNAGTGYVSTPTASISGDGTSAVLGVVTLNLTTVASLTIVDAGTGYTSAPTLTIASPTSGDAATATATVTTAGVKIKNSEHYLASYSSGEGVVGEFAAKYPGTLGNSVKVSMADANTYTGWTYEAQFDAAPSTSTFVSNVGGSNDEMHVVVVDEDGVITGTAGTIIEKFAFVSKSSDAKRSDGTNNFYKDVLNSRSQWIWWMDHPSGMTNWGTTSSNKAFTNLSAPVTRSLSGGTDDFTLTGAEQIDAYMLFQDAERYDVSLIMMGRASAAIVTNIIGNVAESRLDCVVFASPINNTSGDIIIGTGSEAANQVVAYREALPSTSYAVLDSGFKYQYDRYSDKYRYVPLNGDIAGLCARTDFTNDPWFSPGGLSRGQIKNVVRLAFNPTKTHRDTLYKKGVNPVVTFPGEGTVLFGDKTLLAKPSAFDRINVRRLFIVLEKAIATAAKFQLFEFNDPFTRAQFKNLVEPFLRDVQGRRGITEFRVKCDDTNNTPEVIDRNEFVADIFVKPTRSINFITLNFIAARTGANFDEIGA